MNEILQIVGSVASIGSIPLAIYLYLKSQAEKYLTIRRDIVNRLSFQIGEGRKLTLFEIQAVIATKVRESRIKSNVIMPDEIVEDLVTETINSPLLERAKKEEIVTNLGELHSLSKLYILVSSETSIFSNFLEFLKESKPDTDTETDKIKKALERETIEVRKKENLDTPELFARLAAVIALVASMITIFDLTTAFKIIPKLFNSELLTSMSLGMVASIVAAILVVFIKYFITRR